MPSDTALNIALTITGNEQVQMGYDQVGMAASQTGNLLISNRMAFRELAHGLTSLGTAALGVGVAMEMSSNKAIEQAGQWVVMAGGIATAIGASFQFITSISTMVKGLKDLQVAEILAKAFSGWGGIAMLGVGAAAAVGVTAYATKMSRAENKVTSSQVHTVNLDSNAIATETHRQLLLKEQRSYSTGIK